MTPLFPSCDGIRRRDVLKIGFAGTLGFSLSLPDLLKRQAAAETASAAGRRNKHRDVSLIIIYLQGGMSTIDAFDLKPEAPPEFRGDFRPIDTVGSRPANLRASADAGPSGRQVLAPPLVHAQQFRTRHGRPLHAHGLLAVRCLQSELEAE